MGLNPAIAFIGFFLLACAAVQAEDSYATILEASSAKSDLKIEVEVELTESSGGKSEEPQKLSRVLYFDRDGDRVLIKKETHKQLSEPKKRQTWSDDFKSTSVEIHNSEAERWGDFLKMNMDLTWVLAAPGNAEFIDQNFSLKSVTPKDGKKVLSFDLTDEPVDSYLASLKKAKGTAAGKITLDISTGTIESASFEMTRGDYGREFKIGIKNTAGSLPGETFDVPKAVAEKIERKLKRKATK